MFLPPASTSASWSAAPTPTRWRSSESWSRPPGNDDLHLLVALDEDRVAAAGLLQEADLGEALHDLFPDDGQLQLGQAVADAAVDAVAERQVLARPGPVDEIGVGVRDRLL